MAKRLTSWRKKGRTAPSVDYDDGTVDYDSPTARYAGNGETPASVIKQTSAWSKRVKQLTRFIINPLAYANDAVYDSSSAYDAALTYDGIVVGEPRSTAKKPADWRKA